jgi:hypothetical protein
VVIQVSRDVAYINGLTVSIGGNAAGERVLIVAACRVQAEDALPSSAASSSAATAVATAAPEQQQQQQLQQGRVLRKDRVGGQVLVQGDAVAAGKAGAAAAASSAAAAALLADLTGASTLPCIHPYYLLLTDAYTVIALQVAHRPEAGSSVSLHTSGLCRS